MNAKRLMAMMTARGVAIGTVGGGRAEITRADVAAGLSFAGVSVTADRLIRLAYCDDVSQIALLKAGLVHELRNQVTCDRPMRYAMVSLARMELMGRRLCATCNGAGTVAIKPCTVCHGAGLKAWSQRSRAEALSVALSTFQRTLISDADKVYQYVSNLEQDALTALAKQFADRAA